MSTKKVCCLVWVDPDDCNPPHSLDLTSEHDLLKVEFLQNEFETNGFDLNMPALVGYPLDGRIQLLSGTHRHLAAKLAKIKLPITLWLRSDVESTWGTDLWPRTIEDIPVNQLDKFEIAEGFAIQPYQRYEPNNETNN